MQTHFSTQQRQDRDVQAMDQVLRRCVHCGMCNATCPTFLLLGDERDGPRGRIYLIKQMLENETPPTPTITRHVDRCLSCLSCMTTCPSGVDYRRLVDRARPLIESHRPWLHRLLRRGLIAILLRPRLLRMMLTLGRLTPLALLPPLGPGGRSLRALITLAHRWTPPTARRAHIPHAHPPIAGASPASLAMNPDRQPPQLRATNRLRVALLTGCVQQVLMPEINAATTRLLKRLGAEIVDLPGFGCCGSLEHHLGNPPRRALAANLLSWAQNPGIDRLVITASGCGATLKDYAAVAAECSNLSSQAQTHTAPSLAACARDITEIVDECAPQFQGRFPFPLRIAYHSACALQHGQGITDLPKRLLSACGATVLAPEESHICCGSAGTYNIFQAQIAERLRVRKLAAIARLSCDILATGNIGCMMQLAGAQIPVVHTAQLLDWATGGAVPPEMYAHAKTAALLKAIA